MSAADISIHNFGKILTHAPGQTKTSCFADVFKDHYYIGHLAVKEGEKIFHYKQEHLPEGTSPADIS